MDYTLFPKLPFIPPAASTMSGASDALFWALHIISLFVTVGIAACLIFFVVRYRRGSKVDRTLPEHEGIALELTWTIIPLIIFMMFFVWSTTVYFRMVRVPEGAMEVFVVGKQWMWKIQQPNGRWEMNELHVPVGRPVKLTMISEDVIHDFGLPAFRLKMDVVPGKYTSMWFEATQTGRFRIFCSQYCGTNHSIMAGYVTVMEPADYERWLATGNQRGTSAANGERLFRELGCTGCHGYEANVRAPSLEGIYNKPRPVQIPGEGNRPHVIVADQRYLHDSIILPEKEIAAGFKPIMPSYKGQISESEVLQLIDYIRSLGTSNGTSNGSAKTYDGGSGATPEGRAGTASTSPNADLSQMVDRDATFDGARDSSKESHADLSQMVDRDEIYNNEPRSSGEARGAVSNPARRRNYRMENSFTKEAGRVYSGVGSSKIGDEYTRSNNNNITRLPKPVYPLKEDGSPASTLKGNGAARQPAGAGRAPVSLKGTSSNQTPRTGERNRQ